jgi:hypothetical protein
MAKSRKLVGALITGLASLGAIGIVLAVMLALGLVASAIVGIYLAFSASIILGIIVLLVEPLPLLIGLVYLLAHVDLAQKIVEFISK